VRLVAFAIALVCAAPQARAAVDARPIVGFRVEGKSKLHDKTIGYLAHVEIGDPVSDGMIPQLEAALMSSELFETAWVRLDEAPGGVTVVAILHDKMSWIAAPTVFILPSHWAIGAGYAESDLNGQNKKMLLYGQLGNRTSLFLGTFLDPSINGTKWLTRFDVYLLHEIISEYKNPTTDARSFTVDRESTETFLDAGALVGYTFAWWMIGDVRLRGAYVYFRDAHAIDINGSPSGALPVPEVDGWDVSLQLRGTLDARSHRYGVTWGPYAQLILEPSVPGLDSFHYQLVKARAYYSWKFFEEHELELRTRLIAGRHVPFHEETTLGGVADLRGYDVDQFRGDFATFFRAEYSVPLFKWKVFAFRALGFWDSGYLAYLNHDPTNRRNFLPDQIEGQHWFRNDVGAGLRVYLKSIVVPLLGFDVGYGIEGHSPEVYFEIGLTDF
jgi:outer membrane protein assembly factor BamA